MGTVLTSSDRLFHSDHHRESMCMAVLIFPVYRVTAAESHEHMNRAVIAKHRRPDAPEDMRIGLHVCDSQDLE